jgi:hypothetical protein
VKTGGPGQFAKWPPQLLKDANRRWYIFFRKLAVARFMSEKLPGNRLCVRTGEFAVHPVHPATIAKCLTVADSAGIIRHGFNNVMRAVLATREDLEAAS